MFNCTACIEYTRTIFTYTFLLTTTPKHTTETVLPLCVQREWTWIIGKICIRMSNTHRMLCADCHCLPIHCEYLHATYTQTHIHTHARTYTSDKKKDTNENKQRIEQHRRKQHINADEFFWQMQISHSLSLASFAKQPTEILCIILNVTLKPSLMYRIRVVDM